MPRAKPPVERTCLVCDAMFMGTPAATRCDPCKSAGHKVPHAKQATRAGKKPRRRRADPDKPLHTLVCHACGEEHETTRAKAKRCDPCIEAGRRVQTTTCILCDEKFPTIGNEGERVCSECHSDPVNREAIAERMAEEEERQREEDQKARIARNMNLILDICDRLHPVKKQRKKRSKADPLRNCPRPPWSCSPTTSPSPGTGMATPNRYPTQPWRPPGLWNTTE
jgi:hypothetical protein